MAYQFVFDVRETVRQSPVRVVAALVLLVATSLYFFTADQSYRVAELGAGSQSANVTDLTQSTPWETEVSLISADDADPHHAPAWVRRSEGREQYIDAQLTHAVAEGDATQDSRVAHIIPVSGQYRSSPAVKDRPEAGTEPVWLTGVVVEDE